MTKSEADLLTLLRDLDAAEWLEQPQYYNRSQTAVLSGDPMARLGDSSPGIRRSRGRSHDRRLEIRCHPFSR